MKREPSKPAVSIPLITILIGLLLLGTWWVAFGAPTQSPPSGNPAQPLNISTTTQTKLGGLNIATQSGNVGIGTTTPATALHVIGTSTIAGNVKVTGTGYGIIFPDATTQTTAATAGTNFWTLSDTSLYPTSTAYNVGIGTTTPASKLTVSGDIRIAGTGSGIRFPDGSTASSTGGVPKGILVFTAGGTFTVPAGVTNVWVEVQGGGGGGGGRDPNNYGSGGGGAGGYSEGLVTVTPSQQITVTIGGGGAAGSYSSGGTGESSSFGAIMTATGGSGGAKTGTNYLNVGGSGGTASGGSVNIGGGPGQGGINATASYYFGGQGGDSHFAGGGAGGMYIGGNTTYPTSPPANSGAGGGGGAGYYSDGTAGAGGIVIVRW